MLKIILNRLNPQAEKIIAEEQAGFRVGRTTRSSTYAFYVRNISSTSKFQKRIMTDALEDHEGTVSIGGRTIINLCFADDIDGLAQWQERKKNCQI